MQNLDPSCITVNEEHASYFALYTFVFFVLHSALYYQRRWVKLDVDYLRYFDNDKVTTTCTVTLTRHHFDLSYWYSAS